MNKFKNIIRMVLAVFLCFGIAGTAFAEFRVALMYPGTSKDLSWSNAVFDGAMNAKNKDSSISIETVELLNDPQVFEQQGVAFAAQWCAQCRRRWFSSRERSIGDTPGKFGVMSSFFLVDAVQFR